MVFQLFRNKREETHLEGSENFAKLWTHCRPVVEELSTRLQDTSFKPTIEQQFEANAICEMNFGLDLRSTLLVVVNGLLRHSTGLSLDTLHLLDKHFDAYGITDRMIFYSKEKELHINLIPKQKTEGVLLIQFNDQDAGLTFYYDECNKGGKILL